MRLKEITFLLCYLEKERRGRGEREIESAGEGGRDKGRNMEGERNGREGKGRN